MLTKESPATVSLSLDQLTLLITLCDARAYNLRKFVAENPDDSDAPYARDDIVSLGALSRTLRDARGV